MNLCVRNRARGVGTVTMRVGVCARIPPSDKIKNSSRELGSFRKNPSSGHTGRCLPLDETDALGCEMSPLVHSSIGWTCISAALPSGKL